MSRTSSSPRRLLAVLPLALGAILLVVVAIKVTNNQPERPPNPAPATTSKAPASLSQAAVPEKVPLRPLPVSRSTAAHEWTDADATQPLVIEKIAHNPDEFIRLVEENDRIKRRQLVYRNETVPMLLQRAGGQPLKSFTLPGLDGREVEVEVTETRLNGTSGSIIGRVKGRLNSMVSVGFSNGCESFNVISPDENLFLTADAREPGEVLVKEIDLDKYQPPAGAADDFILTNPSSKQGPGHSR